MVFKTYKESRLQNDAQISSLWGTLCRGVLVIELIDIYKNVTIQPLIITPVVSPGGIKLLIFEPTVMHKHRTHIHRPKAFISLRSTLSRLYISKNLLSVSLQESPELFKYRWKLETHFERHLNNALWMNTPPQTISPLRANLT